MKTRVSLKYFATDCLWKPFTDSNLLQTPSNLISFTVLVTLRPSTFFQFICFYFIYIWLKITHLHKKKYLYSYSNNRANWRQLCHWTGDAIFPERILQINVNKQADTHICSHIDPRNTQMNVSIPVQWNFWCSNPTCCRYILLSRHGHCKSTHFLIFLL